jgi:hypothetical protein
MKKTTKFLISLAVFLMLVVPVLSFAAGLVPCGTNDSATPLTNHPCEFKDFMTLINNVIRFILFDMVVPIAAIMFFYAGFELVTSGGSTEKKGIAKKVFTNAVKGLVLAAGAWLIIRTILLILGYNGTWIGF